MELIIDNERYWFDEGSYIENNNSLSPIFGTNSFSAASDDDLELDTDYGRLQSIDTVQPQLSPSLCETQNNNNPPIVQKQDGCYSLSLSDSTNNNNPPIIQSTFKKIYKQKARKQTNVLIVRRRQSNKLLLEIQRRTGKKPKSWWFRHFKGNLNRNKY